MVKKSLKNPPAKSGNTATVSESITVSPPAPVSTPAHVLSPERSPAPYKPIMDDASIKCLLGLAKDSPIDSALCIVWRHAYDEGYQKGQIEVLQNLGKKLEEKFKEGKKEGKDLYYERGIVRGEYDKYERWKLAGHGYHCLAVTAQAHLEDAGTQTDLIPTTTASISTQNELFTSVLCQTQNTFILTTFTTTVGIQTDPRTFRAMSQSPVPSENRKSTKINSASEISLKFIVFSSPMPSITSSNLNTQSMTTTALKTQLTMANFAQKQPKVKIAHISIQTNSQTSSIAATSLPTHSTASISMEIEPSSCITCFCGPSCCMAYMSPLFFYKKNPTSAPIQMGPYNMNKNLLYYTDMCCVMVTGTSCIISEKKKFFIHLMY